MRDAVMGCAGFGPIDRRLKSTRPGLKPARRPAGKAPRPESGLSMTTVPIPTESARFGLPPWHVLRAYLIGCVPLAIVYTVANETDGDFTRGFDLLSALGGTLRNAGAAFVLLPLVWAYTGWMERRGFSVTRVLVNHGLTAIVFAAVVQLMSYWLIWAWYDLKTAESARGRWFIWQGMFMMMLYWAVAGGFTAYRAAQRARRSCGQRPGADAAGAHRDGRAAQQAEPAFPLQHAAFHPRVDAQGRAARERRVADVQRHAALCAGHRKGRPGPSAFAAGTGFHARLPGAGSAAPGPAADGAVAGGRRCAVSGRARVVGAAGGGKQHQTRLQPTQRSWRPAHQRAAGCVGPHPAHRHSRRWPGLHTRGVSRCTRPGHQDRLAPPAAAARRPRQPAHRHPTRRRLQRPLTLPAP